MQKKKKIKIKLKTNVAEEIIAYWRFSVLTYSIHGLKFYHENVQLLVYLGNYLILFNGVEGMLSRASFQSSIGQRHKPHACAIVTCRL